MKKWMEEVVGPFFSPSESAAAATGSSFWVAPPTARRCCFGVGLEKGDISVFRVFFAKEAPGTASSNIGTSST